MPFYTHSKLHCTPMPATSISFLPTYFCTPLPIPTLSLPLSFHTHFHTLHTAISPTFLSSTYLHTYLSHMKFFTTHYNFPAFLTFYCVVFLGLVLFFFHFLLPTRLSYLPTLLLPFILLHSFSFSSHLFLLFLLVFTPFLCLSHIVFIFLSHLLCTFSISLLPSVLYTLSCPTVPPLSIYTYLSPVFLALHSFLFTSLPFYFSSILFCPL